MTSASVPGTASTSARPRFIIICPFFVALVVALLLLLFVVCRRRRLHFIERNSVANDFWHT